MATALLVSACSVHTPPTPCPYSQFTVGSRLSQFLRICLKQKHDRRDLSRLHSSLNVNSPKRGGQVSDDSLAQRPLFAGDNNPRKASGGAKREAGGGGGESVRIYL